MNEFIGDALIGVALIAGAGALVYGAKKTWHYPCAAWLRVPRRAS